MQTAGRFHFTSLDSTNLEAKRRIVSGAVHGDVITADTQTNGYGRQGREWSSEKGNLFLSLIVKPQSLPEFWAQLSFVTAVALHQLLLDYGVMSSLKWPNDLLVSKQKIAGILLEGQQNTVIIGVGVNCSTSPNIAMQPTTSLADHSKNVVDTVELIEGFLSHFWDFYAIWSKQGFAPIREYWLEYGHKPGDMLKVVLPGIQYTGSFLQLDHDGKLTLLMGDGKKKNIEVGDVFIV